MASQVKSLEVNMFELFLIHFVLNYFPPEYGPFKTHYNTKGKMAHQSTSEGADIEARETWKCSFGRS